MLLLLLLLLLLLRTPAASHRRPLEFIILWLVRPTFSRILSVSVGICSILTYFNIFSRFSHIIYHNSALISSIYRNSKIWKSSEPPGRRFGTLGGSLGCARRALGELLERFLSFCCVPWATLSTIVESRRLPRPENSEKLEFADPPDEIIIFLKAAFSIN